MYLKNTKKYMYVSDNYTRQILENKCRTKKWLAFNATRKRNTHWSRWYRFVVCTVPAFFPHFERHRPKIKTVTQTSKFNATFLSSTAISERKCNAHKRTERLSKSVLHKKLQHWWSWIYMWNKVLFEGFKKLENHSQCLVCEAIIHLKPTHSSRISKEE